MDPTLYYEIYEEGVNKQAILRYLEYAEFRYLYNLIKDHVWRT